jgi:hypothetical protein
LTGALKGHTTLGHRASSPELISLLTSSENDIRLCLFIRVMFEIYMASVDCKHRFQKQTHAENFMTISKRRKIMTE